MDRASNGSEQFPAGGSGESGQEVAKTENPSKKAVGSPLGKSDLRYWQAKLFHASYTVEGKKRETADWCARMQYCGRRELFSLGTPNKAAAAARARDIYLCLAGAGWDEVLARFKNKRNAVVEARSVFTVGDFISSVKATATGRPKTVEDYCRAFRTIVAQIREIDGGKAKFDYRKGGRAQWLAKVEAVRLGEITPQGVQDWKREFLRRAGRNPLKIRAAKISFNSLVRQAKSLFAADILTSAKLKEVDSPFEGIAFEQRPSMRYRSGFSVEAIIAKAQQELPQEELKILLLAAMAGLRRNEIDKLEWTAFRWDDTLIRIEPIDGLARHMRDALPNASFIGFTGTPACTRCMPTSRCKATSSRARSPDLRASLIYSTSGLHSRAYS